MTFAEGCWVLYLVVYDVVDDRVRDEMREVLRDFGGVRVQYSAFLVELSRGEVQEAARRLAVLAARTEADVRFIPLCSRDQERVTHISSRGGMGEGDRVV